jgi:mono/diheme cytochrome c family protein
VPSPARFGTAALGADHEVCKVMDFPLFHLDFFGNRNLIALIASLHVVINHALAVGAIPLIALLEWYAWRRRDAALDELAYRILFVAFIVTTSVGALTGVGIWLSTSLVNPVAIGSLIRIFFWAWFGEWIVFALEVMLILFYCLTWRGWGRKNKRAHIAVGGALALVSWATMAIIVAILGFQMDTGLWTVAPGLRTALLNPIYLPQLIFRTPFAMVTAGAFALLTTMLLTRGDRELRARAVRLISAWSLAWTGPWLLGAWNYYRVVPASQLGNFPVALGTMQFEQLYGTLGWLIAAAVAAMVLVMFWGLAAPRRLPGLALVVPLVLSVWLLSYFERVREFVRKPDVIEEYLYSNGLRRAEYPLLAEDGVLAHAAYSPIGEVGAGDDVVAGREMFRLACSRCHTTVGVNGIVQKLGDLFGWQEWDPAAVDAYLNGIHGARPFMPPVPGNEAERAALVQYFVSLRRQPLPLHGAQTAGAANRYD